MAIQQRSERASALTPDGRHWRIPGMLKSRSLVLTAAALALVLYFHQASGGLFLTTTNSSLLLRQTAVVAVVACGVALLIIMGEIDLSIGSAVFFTGLIAAQCQVSGWGIVPTILAAMAAGLVIGLLTGAIVTILAVPAFVVTLAGLLLWRGIGLMWTDAEPIGPVSSELIALTEGRMPTPIAYAFAASLILVAVWRTVKVRQVSAERGERVPVLSLSVIPLVAVAGAAILIWVGRSPAGLPNALFWITGVAVVLGLVTSRAKFGRRAYLVGSNKEAAVYAGINSRRTILVGFLVIGAIYGIAGVMLTARLGTSTPDSGVNLELVAIAAAVIGGNSLRGGIGSIRGAILGAFLLSTIDNGMGLLGVSSYAESVVKGLILVFAVAVDGYFTRRQSAT